MHPSDEKRESSADSENEGQGREWEARSFRSRLLPFIIKPQPTREDAETHEQPWLTKEQRAVHWIDLLYDLVIVAVLNVFSSHHEVSSSGSVLIYFSFFVVIWWVWASQTLYDTRFQPNDWLHRVLKFLQLGVFAFVGAMGAEYFDPSHVIGPANITDPDAVADAGGAAAFAGVAIAYGVGRMLLVLQYLLVTFHARRHKKHMASLLVPAIASLVSGLMWFISAGLIQIPQAGDRLALAPVKVGLAYGGLCIEYVCGIAMPLLSGYIRPPEEFVSERFGELTLIILGEGIIGIVSSFSAVIAGFGFTTMAYIQCFCALIIVSACWHILFHGFDKEIRVGRERGLLWLVLHLPLHFCILLLLAGMKNAATYGNINDAWSLVDNEFSTLQAGLISGIHTGQFSSNASSITYLTLQFEKLSLNPTFPVEIVNLQSEFDDLSSFNASNVNQTSTFIDPVIDIIQYESQFLTSLSSAYGVRLSDEVNNLAVNISNLTRTFIPDVATRNKTLNASLATLQDFKSAYMTDLGQGVLFFLPAAGGLLFLSSIMVLLRAPPLGAGMWASWTLQTIFGLGLGLLGFLDMGNQTITDVETNEILVYRLLDAKWTLPIVTITYAAYILLDCIVLVVAKFYEGERAPYSASNDSQVDVLEGKRSASPDGIAAQTVLPYDRNAMIGDETHA